MPRVDMKGLRQEPSGSWSYRITRNGHTTFKGGFPTPELASRARAAKLGLLAAAVAGIAPDPKAIPRVSELADAFFVQRYKTHVAAKQDEARWHTHMKATFGHMRLHEINIVVITEWARRMSEQGQSGSSIRVMLAILSGIFEEVIDTIPGLRNPCKGLPKKLLAGPLKKDEDPTKIPFVRKWDDVRRIYLALPDHVARLYALCVHSGLRPAEGRALQWKNVDLANGIIHVVEQVRPDNVVGALKSKRTRVAPIMDGLMPLLKKWHLEDGGQGLVVKPGKQWKDIDFLYRGTPTDEINKVLVDLGMEQEGLNWYRATRHTFASHWVMAGNSIEELSKILGHSSIVVTERYVHLRPDRFTAKAKASFGAHIEGSNPIPLQGEVPVASNRR